MGYPATLTELFPAMVVALGRFKDSAWSSNWPGFRPMLTDIHPHSHIHTHSISLLHTHTYMQTHSLIHSHSQIHTCTQTHSLSLSHTHALPLSLSHTHTHTHTHMCTRTHTHSQTHKHTFLANLSFHEKWNEHWEKLTVSLRTWFSTVWWVLATQRNCWKMSCRRSSRCLGSDWLAKLSLCWPMLGKKRRTKKVLKPQLNLFSTKIQLDLNV